MKFRRFFEGLLHNWPAKILSLAAAIVLFFVYRMSTLEERFISVPLQVPLSGELVPASDWPRTVRVSLRGESNSIYPVLEDDIEARLDFSGLTEEGITKAAVIINKRGIAASLETLEIHVEPSEVSLALEYREERMVSITPSFRGYLETGWELSSWTVEPAMVTVSGPASRIARLESISTEVIELGGRKEAFSQNVRLLSLDPLVRLSGDGMVNFAASITEASLERDLGPLPVRINGLEERFRALVENPQASLRLQGPWPRLEPLEPGDGAVYVDCSEINRAGEYRLPVQTLFPSFVKVLRTQPAELLVQVVPRPPEPLEDREAADADGKGGDR